VVFNTREKFSVVIIKAPIIDQINNYRNDQEYVEEHVHISVYDVHTALGVALVS